MEIYPKSPQELASQVVDVYTLEHGMDSELVPHGQELAEQFTQSRDMVTGALMAGVSDGELQNTLDTLYDAGDKSGTVNPLRGERAEEVTQRAEEVFNWNTSFGLARAARGGYLGHIRQERRAREKEFKNPISNLIETVPLETGEEAKRMEALLERTIDIDTVTVEERERLAQDFPGGNFLFHSAKSAEIIGIANSGSLLNYGGILRREQELAQLEGRSPRFLTRNSGFEGVSWSMNALDAVPGNRFHLAGFISSPNAVLNEDQQLAVPSRPAPYEVIQISGDINSNKFYELKVQGELYEAMVGLGEANSVQANLSYLRKFVQDREKAEASEKEQSKITESTLANFINKNTDDQIDTLLADSSTIRSEGTIELNTRLYQQASGESVIPAGAAWLQGLITSGRIRNVSGFEDATTLRDILTRVDTATVDNFVSEYRKDAAYITENLTPEVEKVEEVGVSISDMYLVASQKDLSSWLRVLARTSHQPKGILLYDNKKVRLENFAKPYTGNSQELTDELRAVIPPSEGYIDWQQEVLGDVVTREKRAGNNLQVVAEHYLDKRKTIHKEGDQLVVI